MVKKSHFFIIVIDVKHTNDFTIMEEQNLRVKVRGRVFRCVDSFAFMMQSMRYRREHTVLGGEIVIMADVDERNLGMFLDACQGASIEIGSECVPDLELLCEEWDVRGLKAKVDEFVSDHKEEMLIRMIGRNLRRGGNVRALEKQLFTEFVGLCKKGHDQELRELGVPVLARVFAMNENELVRKHLHDVFRFIVGCLRCKRIGSVASVFFHGASFADFTAQEREILLDEPAMDFACLNAEKFKEITQYSSVVAKYQLLLEESEKIRATQLAEIKELRSEFSRIVAEVKQQQEVLKKKNEEQWAKIKDDYRKVAQKTQAVLDNLSVKNAYDDHVAIGQAKETLSKLEKEGKEVRFSVQKLETEWTSLRRAITELKRNEGVRLSTASPTDLFTKSLRPRRRPLQQTQKQYHQPIEILYLGNPFKGIINYLRNQCHGNPHERELLIVSASNGSEPMRLLDPDNVGSEFAGDTEGAWFKLDFCGNQVTVTDYTLASDQFESQNPTAWILEGSNDDDSWTALDIQDTDDLVQPDAVHTYSCQVQTGTFRYIRITMTRSNSNIPRFYLRNIELFGMLFVNES